MYILGNGKKPLFYPVSDISGQWNKGAGYE